MFPAEPVLIARGKYSTLKHEWREQMKRVQDIGRTMQANITLAVADCQAKPPANGMPVVVLEKCAENLKDARERLITLSLGMAELESEAWPK